MPRGIFRGTGLKLLDMSLTKDTKFSERFTGQFRFEVFNILNMTQYSYAATNTTNPASLDDFWLGQGFAGRGNLESRSGQRRGALDPVGLQTVVLESRRRA